MGREISLVSGVTSRRLYKLPMIYLVISREGTTSWNIDVTSNVSKIIFEMLYHSLVDWNVLIRE